ncbi:hypothetical protein Tco_0313807, partial [Tanacetum coccineum]
MQKQINILENDIQRCQKQSLDFELQLQHENESKKCESSLKNVCETSWISKMEKLESENVSLEFQVQSLIKERESVKSEYQKLFNSIKKTRTQTQGEIDELIEHVNQKTYSYADVRAQNQDLLITISKLKAKLKNVEKGLRAASSVRGPSNRDSSFKNSVLANTKKSSEKVENVLIPCHDKCHANYKLNVHSKVRRALFTTPRTVKSKFEDTTPVVSKTKIAVVTPLSAKNKVSSAFTLRDNSLSNHMKNKIQTSRIWQKCCSKHMTGDRSLLENFATKLMGTVRFGNDHFAAITGYGDYVQGNII